MYEYSRSPTSCLAQRRLRRLVKSLMHDGHGLEFVYDRARLCSLRGSIRGRPIPAAVYNRLSALQILRRHRGCRAGRRNHIPDDAKVFNITVIASSRRSRHDDCLSSTRRRRVLVKCRREPEMKYITVGSLNAQSIGNKHAMISDCITTDNFDMFAVVESWHESRSCPDLISLTPNGYRCIEQARRRSDDDAENVTPNHGGVVLVYRSFYNVRCIELPEYTRLECIAAYIQGQSVNLLVVVIYRPGSRTVDQLFLTQFADIIERLAVFAAPILIVGDVNIHLDDLSLTHTVDFNNILSDCGLTQHVQGPTHRGGHTLDVIITKSSTRLLSLVVDPPLLSDHSLIVAQLPVAHVTFDGSTTTHVKRRHRWSEMDVDAFANDLRASPLVCDPPVDDCDEYFDCYDRTLRQLVDKHVPLDPPSKFVVRRVNRHAAPWYNDACRFTKRKTRRLEKHYRRTRSPDALKQLRIQWDIQRGVMQHAYSDYWTRTVEQCPDSKSLWRTLDRLLDPPPVVCGPFSAEQFGKFFVDKVETIRSSTLGAPVPTIRPRSVERFDKFEAVTPEEINKLIREAPNKQCELDPAPTWLIKQHIDILAPTLTGMANACFRNDSFPASQKQAIVRPRLKKPSLGPLELNSYRLISKMSFTSKIVERLAVNRFNRHSNLHGLLPSRQSAYRPYHSTETAVAVVHDYIVRAIDDGDVVAMVLLDLSAEFDTVDHSILLDVLHERFGVDDEMMAP